MAQPHDIAAIHTSSNLHVQVLWGLPARFCKEIITDNIPLHVASRKVDFVFSKWLQGLVATGKKIDLNMKSATAPVYESKQVPHRRVTNLPSSFVVCLLG